MKQEFPGTKIVYKTPNYFRGNLINQHAVLSGYNAFRIREIIFELFQRDGVVDVVDVWNQTESAWNFMGSCDVAGCNTGSIHPGTGTSPRLLFLEMVRSVVDIL